MSIPNTVAEKLGQALQNERMKIEEVGAYSLVSLASGQFASVKVGAGFLTRIILGTPSVRFTVFDNSSGLSGTIIMDIAPMSKPGTIFVGASILNGLSIRAGDLGGTCTVITSR